MGTDCGCEGEDTEVATCSDNCCPVWHIEINGTWVEQNNQNLTFSSCPTCGEGEQVASRRCQCTSKTGDMIFFDVEQCGVDNGEIIKEKSYEAWSSKPCLNLPCCAGLTEWSSWESCETACFDHEVFGLTKQKLSDKF